MSAPVRVVVAAPHLGDDTSYIEEVDPRIRVLVADDWELDVPLRDAEILLLGWPVPEVVAAKAPRLRWLHHTQAGVSNLLGSDVWTADLTITSSRGRVAVSAIAEYAMAGIFHFARGVDTAIEHKAAGRFSRRGYRMVGLRGSTLAVVGLGGIGREVARLGRALGMRVVATRRSVGAAVPDPDADLVVPAAQTADVVSEADFVVLCSQLTDETRGFFDSALFAAMKPGSVFVNIARGEEVDESALVAAVKSGHIRGALLDVHAGESIGASPAAELIETPGIILTPHLSGTGDRAATAPVKELFVENLRRYLGGEPLLNLVDRERGY